MWVKQQRLVIAFISGFHVGQNRVGVIADGFGVNHGDVDVMAREARCLDADAALQSLVAQISTPGPGGNHQVNGVAFGRDAKLFVANPGQRANVATGQLVNAHHIELRLHHLSLRERNLHAQNFGAVEEALGVLFQSKNTGAAVLQMIGAHALKRTTAVMQRVGQHVDFCVTPLNHLTVHPDFSVAVRHGGRGGCCHGVP